MILYIHWILLHCHLSSWHLGWPRGWQGNKLHIGELKYVTKMVKKLSCLSIMFLQEISSLPFHWTYVSFLSIPKSLKISALLKICSWNLSRSPPRMRPFTPIWLERSTIALLYLMLIFYPCCCCLIHILITMHKWHLLHGLAGNYLSKNNLGSSKINLFHSSFASVRMKM